MRNYKTDTTALKVAMVQKEIGTITELSDLTGVGRDTLSRILSGKIQPSTGVMDKLIIGLDLTPEDAGRIFFAHNLRKA